MCILFDIFAQIDYISPRDVRLLPDDCCVELRHHLLLLGVVTVRI